MNQEQEKRLDETLKEDRQWLRPHRLQHAKFMLNQAKEPEEKELWRAVIKSNSY